MMQQCIDERPRPVAGSGVDDDSGRLVQDKQVIVLAQHLQRNRFALEFERFRLRDIHRDLVTGLDLVTRLDHLIVDPDSSGENEALQRRAGDIPFTIDKKDIKPFGLFSGCHQKFRDHDGPTLLKRFDGMQSMMTVNLPPDDMEVMLSSERH